MKVIIDKEVLKSYIDNAMVLSAIYAINPTLLDTPLLKEGYQIIGKEICPNEGPTLANLTNAEYDSLLLCGDVIEMEEN